LSSWDAQIEDKGGIPLWKKIFRFDNDFRTYMRKLNKILARETHPLLSVSLLSLIDKQKAQESPQALELFDLREDFLKTAGKMRFIEGSYGHCDVLCNDYWHLMRERQNNTIRMTKLLSGGKLNGE